MSSRTIQSHSRNSQARIRRSAQIYLFLLMIFAPITSYLVAPFQGLTPANVLLMASIVIPFFGIQYQLKTYVYIFAFVIIYTQLLVLALLSYMVDLPNLVDVIQIRTSFIVGWLRLSHITQGVYLLCAAVFFFHVYNNASEKMLKNAYLGIIILLIYGFYEFFYYAIIGSSGDFISNRVFGDLEVEFRDGDYLNGSLVQQSLLFGNGFMRFKSLTGEPSMFSLTVTPFFVFAFANRHWKMAIFLLVSLILSNSTTAIIGLVAGLFVIYCRRSTIVLFGLPATLLTIAVLYGSSDAVQNVLDRILFDKLGSSSGVDRIESMINHAEVVFDGNIIRLFFGLGFGTVRSLDMFSNILANTGLFGFIMYSAIILVPIFFLRGDPQRVGLQAVLVSIWSMEMLSVSEFSYLPPWFFIAMAHKRARILEKLGFRFGHPTNKAFSAMPVKQRRKAPSQGRVRFSGTRGPVH